MTPPVRPEALLEFLNEMPRRIEALLRGVPRPRLSWTPAPGNWSILEVLLHLRDTEIGLGAALNQSVLGAKQPPGQAAAHLERDAPPFEVLREWKRLRRETLQLLRQGTSTTWGIEVVHPQAGRVNLEQAVAHQAEHDQRHLRQIETVLERHAILTRLAATPREIRTLVEGLPAEVLRRSPGPESASLRDEMTALGRFEAQMQVRYARILEFDRPALPPLDVEPSPPRWQDAVADPMAALRDFERLRALTHDLLHVLGPRIWQRKGLHPQRGELSIADLVTQHLDRDTASLARLRAARAAVLPKPGYSEAPAPRPAPTGP
jgi:hypothetical protein